MLLCWHGLPHGAPAHSVCTNHYHKRCPARHGPVDGAVTAMLPHKAVHLLVEAGAALGHAHPGRVELGPVCRSSINRIAVSTPACPMTPRRAAVLAGRVAVSVVGPGSTHPPAMSR